MAGNTTFTVNAGRDATFTGVAVGEGSSAVAIEGWVQEAQKEFRTLYREIEDCTGAGAISETQARLLTDTAKEAEKLVEGGLKTEAEKEKAGFLLGNLVSGFKNFCADNHRSGVFACVQALVALCGLPLIPGLG